MANVRRKRKKKNSGRICITLIVCMLIGVMSIQIVRLYHKDQELQAKENGYTTELKEETARQEELNNYEKYTQTDDYTAEIAKTRLGLVFPNEIVFKEKDSDQDE